MNRRVMWFGLAWSLVFGAFATTTFAHTHSPFQLAGGLLHMTLCAYYVRHLWSDS